MSTSVLLRCASVVSALIAAGHGLAGFDDWSPQGQNDVLRAMTTVRFEVLGISRSYLDFYRGFGHTITILLAAQAVLLWQLAAVARTDPARVRGMVGTLAVAAVACGLVAWKFIFLVPAALSALLAACLLAALVVSG